MRTVNGSENEKILEILTFSEVGETCTVVLLGVLTYRAC